MAQKNAALPPLCSFHAGETMTVHGSNAAVVHLCRVTQLGDASEHSPEVEPGHSSRAANTK